MHRSQSINTSRDLPDNVLTFARRHPLMASQVHPNGLRPLMFKRSVNYVRIAVHEEPALDGNLYTLLFLGTGEFHSEIVARHDHNLFINALSKNTAITFCILTQKLCHPSDDGWLHRAVDIQGKMHIIEELQLFDKSQPIQALVISSALVCAGSRFSQQLTIVQLPH